MEILLVDGFQDAQDRQLQKLVARTVEGPVGVFERLFNFFGARRPSRYHRLHAAKRA